MRFVPQGEDLGRGHEISAFRIGFGPGGWDLGLAAGILASRLELDSREVGVDGGE